MKNTLLFKGTGAALTVCLGMVPDYVRMINISATNPVELIWNKRIARVAAVRGGLLNTNGGALIAKLAITAGIEPYYGGTQLTAASSAILMPYADDSDMRDAVAGQAPVKSWVSDTPGSGTGHFDAGVNTTYVGVGSRVKVYSPQTRSTIEAVIDAISNDGDAADEVTLLDLKGDAVRSGDVHYIGPITDLRGALAGEQTKDGILINATSGINASGNFILLEYGLFTQDH